MWATAEMIDVVGCDNVHLHCDSTDVSYVMSQYNDAGHSLDAAHACLKKKCGLSQCGPISGRKGHA